MDTKAYDFYQESVAQMIGKMQDHSNVRRVFQLALRLLEKECIQRESAKEEGNNDKA